MSTNGRLKDAQYILNMVLQQLEQAKVALSKAEKATLSAQLKPLLQKPISQIETEADGLQFANSFINVVREVSAFTEQIPPLPDQLLRWRGVPSPTISVPVTPLVMAKWHSEANQLQQLGQVLLDFLGDGDGDS